MTGPLTARDRLTPSDRAPKRGRKAPPPPPGGPERGSGRKRGAAGGGRAAARALRGLLTLAGVVLVLGAVGAYGTYRYYASGLPSVDGLRTYQPPVMSRVYAGNMKLLAELATQRRIFTPFAQIPPQLRQAFVSAEDRNYWNNPGIDPLAIARAAVTDISLVARGKRPIGASTITQQVAKNMLLNDHVTLSRKIREAILALRITQAMSKQRILEIYLNEIYLGQGAYGVAAAAQAYFDKPLDKLTLAEDATLASLPKAPTYYDAFNHPNAARNRRDWVLRRMLEDGAITKAEADAANAQPIIPKAAHAPATVAGGQYFADAVKRELIRRFGLQTTTEGGLVVHTSLDPKLQTAAEDALRWGLMAYDKREQGWRGPVTHLGSGPLTPPDWPSLLAKVPPPRGMLKTWRLAMVLHSTPAAATLGWLGAGSTAAKPLTRSGTLALASVGWARRHLKNGLGPAPRTMADVMRPGDVVMVQQVAPSPKTGAKAGAKTNAAPRLVLRQVPTVEGALVSLDPITGRVLALSGGWSFGRSQFDRAIQAQRQPGSGFKPFAYLTAMQAGLTPDSIILDAPFVENMGAAGQYRPGDYEAGFLGPVPIHEALEQSLNLATLHLAQQIGLAPIAKNAEAFGVAKHVPLLYPIALGAIDTTVLHLAAAYASLDVGGLKVTPTLIDSVEDRNGNMLYLAPHLSCPTCSGTVNTPPELISNRKRIADAASTFQTVTMMRGVVERGTGTPAVIGLTNRPIAGKTGTTNNWLDAWFTGFTPDLVTSVWVGFDTPHTLGHNQQGALVAAPIWNRFMRVALKNRPVLQFPVPPGVVLSSAGGATEAFKTGQPQNGGGAGGGGGTNAGDLASTGGGPVGPAASSASSSGGSLDTTLGGLY